MRTLLDFNWVGVLDFLPQLGTGMLFTLLISVVGLVIGFVLGAILSLIHI